MNVYVSILARFLTIIFAIELLRRLLFFAGWHSPISVGCLLQVYVLCFIVRSFVVCGCAPICYLFGCRRISLGLMKICLDDTALLNGLSV